MKDIEIPKHSYKKKNCTHFSFSRGCVQFTIGGEAGICLIASTELARNATRQPGGDRVRQRRCPRIYDMREIPQNGNKKSTLSRVLDLLGGERGI